MRRGDRNENHREARERRHHHGERVSRQAGRGGVAEGPERPGTGQGGSEGDRNERFLRTCPRGQLPDDERQWTLDTDRFRLHRRGAVVINPVTGGLATEGEIRRDLDYWRRFLLTYRSMDKESGGMPAVAEAVVLLENALKDVDKASTDASYEFLKRNQSIH